LERLPPIVTVYKPKLVLLSIFLCH